MPEPLNDPNKEPVKEPTKKPEKKLPGDQSDQRGKEKKLQHPERPASRSAIRSKPYSAVIESPRPRLGNGEVSCKEVMAATGACRNRRPKTIAAIIRRRLREGRRQLLGRVAD